MDRLSLEMEAISGVSSALFGPPRNMDDFVSPSRARRDLSRPFLLSDGCAVSDVFSADCFLAPPRGSFGFQGAAQYIGLAIYLGVSAPERSLLAPRSSGVDISVRHGAEYKMEFRVVWPEGAVVLDIKMREIVQKAALLGVSSTSSANLEPPPHFLRIGI